MRAGSTERDDRPGRRAAVAVVALAVAAAAITFTRVFNYDIFWHLAAGRWMLYHGRVLRADPFSVRPLPRWVNVHWLFELAAAGLHAIGGFGLLSGLKAALAVATICTWALGLARRVPPAMLVICGLLVVAVMETRMRVRPEAFTLLFLTITVVTIEAVRRGRSPRWLWLLAPLMAVWVNMHGLYVLGPAVFWSAFIGAAIDRRLGRGLSGKLASRAALVALLAATAACLASPWPIRAAARPLLLWSRISGQSRAFSLGVSEFIPTWLSPFEFSLAAAILAPAAVACLLDARRVPLG
ncbi:MAG: hypothetical protein J7M21_01295, partial [Planctomycetes bacterium]|nr:hypothetical protein [Planctomycetota bacterium]